MNRQEISKLILSFGMQINNELPNKPIIDFNNNTNEFRDMIRNVYDNLAEENSTIEIPTNVGRYDIKLDDFVIELDEENHFNRYRRETLNSSLYQQLDVGFRIDDYQKYCELYEVKVAKFGRFWTNPGAENQYGAAAPNGIFEGNGSPRWKQRAFYDFLKDISPFLNIINKKVIRISIYDSIFVNNNHYSVNYVLRHHNQFNQEILFNSFKELIHKKLNDMSCIYETD